MQCSAGDSYSTVWRPILSSYPVTACGSTQLPFSVGREQTMPPKGKEASTLHAVGAVMEGTIKTASALATGSGVPGLEGALKAALGIINIAHVGISMLQPQAGSDPSMGNHHRTTVAIARMCRRLSSVLRAYSTISCCRSCNTKPTILSLETCRTSNRASTYVSPH